jgi:hemolysin D
MKSTDGMLDGVPKYSFGQSAVRLSFYGVLTGLIAIVGLLFVPDESKILAFRRLALAPLVEVMGPDMWSRITGQRSGTAVEGLQNAPVWLVALGLAAILLLFGLLLQRGVGYLAGAQRGAAKPEAMSGPKVFETGQSKKEAAELEFLPAALEIVETPPSPTGRAIAASIITLFGVALAWASIGTIDIVASAPGKVLPTGRTKVIQAFETGVVHTIYVRDGQSVKSGEPLVELDATINAAERDHLKSDLVAANLEVARLHASLTEADDPLTSFHPPEGASPSLVAMQEAYLSSQVAEYRAKLKALDGQKAEKQDEVATIAATIKKLEATIPIVQQRVAVRQALKDFGTRLAYLETLQLLTEQQEDLKIQTAHLHEAEAAVATLVDTRAQTVEEYRRSRYAELAEAERKASGIGEDLIKAEQRTKLQLLTAPVDGVVQQLAIHTVGGIVTPAQALLAVVPDDSHLEIEAMVSNRDIGFVHAGQAAEIKVDTFNFTRYGLLHGRVLSLSSDAIARDRRQDKFGAQDDASTSEPAGQELVYAARISLDHAQMQIEDKLVDLTPGMAVTVEIKTGSRRLISYLVSPLVKYGHESLRER